MPLLAAVWPLRQGAASTVREAIADYGLADQSNVFVRGLGRIHGLARVWALALRNSVHNPARLALTLLTLSLGGGIFIAVLTTNLSLHTSLDQMVEVQSRMDVLLALGKAKRISQVLPLVAAQPSVAASVPLSRLLTTIVGVSFLDRPLDFTYAFGGIGGWLAIVLVIGTLASILPARNAANLSVRASLSYA